MSEDDPHHVCAAYEVPAPFANVITVTAIGSGLMRMAFGEAQTNIKPKFRSAVVVRVEDVEEMMKLLRHVIDSSKAPAGARMN